MALVLGIRKSGPRDIPINSRYNASVCVLTYTYALNTLGVAKGCKAGKWIKEMNEHNSFSSEPR